jgi:hypothetical protein
MLIEHSCAGLHHRPGQSDHRSLLPTTTTEGNTCGSAGEEGKGYNLQP